MRSLSFTDILRRTFELAAGLCLALTATLAPVQSREMTSLPGPPDILSTTGSYRWSVVLGDAIFFNANDGCYGDELWKLDALTGNISLLKDIYPGGDGSGPGFGQGPPAHFPIFKGSFYFAPQSPANANTLWRSDGTAAGTVPFYDFSPNGPVNCLGAGDVLYITVYNFASGDLELWKSDGTPQGTVKTIPAGGNVPDLSSATPLGNLLVFPFDNNTTGQEMWRTDGTAAGTFILKDINPGTSDGRPLKAIPAGDKLYFIATGPSNQLYSTDGTVAGTKKVTQGTDIASEVLLLNGKAIYNTITPSNPWQLKITDGTTTSVIRTFTGSTGSDVVQLVGVTNDLAYFLFYSFSGGAVLWKTDGTVSGTAQVKRLGSSDTLVSRSFTLGNKLFMAVQIPQNDKELWMTDGTAAGTTVVKDILPGAQGSDPVPLQSTRGLLYFSANDGVHGKELWKTDGTTAGTSMVKDLEWKISAQRPSNMTALGNNLLFCGTTTDTGRELWKYDAQVGQAQLVKDLQTGTDSGFYFEAQQQFAVSGPYLYLSAYNGAPSNLWRTDGTAAGTVLLQSASGIRHRNGYNFLVPYNGGLLFSRNNELWGTDGTPANTLKLSAADAFPGVVVLSGTALYNAPITTSRSVVYKSNGTVAGTGPVIQSSVTSGPNNSIITMNGRAFFLGAVSPANTELWKTDGTAAGTSMVKNLTGGPGSSSQIIPVSTNNRVFLIKQPTQQTSELWASDGSSNGTLKLSNLVHENFNSVQNPTALGDVLYYTTGPQSSTELWRSDGSPAGTFLLRRFTDNLYSPVAVLSTLGSRILLSVKTTAQGNEPWVTDGTAAGTKSLLDIIPGAGSSDPVFLGKQGTLGYFAATDPTHGREIWVTDGTSAGTRILDDVSPGTDSSFPFWAGNVGTRFFAMYEKDPVSGGVGLAEITPEITVSEGSTPPLTELTDGQDAPVDFGVIRQTRPQSKVLTLSNIGNAPLLISSVSVPLGYSLQDLPPLPVTVRAGQSLVFRLRIDAVALGSFSGRVRIESDDLDEPIFDFPVTGTVVSPEITVHDGSRAAPELTDGQATSIDFGISRQSTPTARPITVVNTGNAPLLISGVTTPAGYTVLQLPPLPATIGVNETLPLQIRVDATALGTFAGTITIASDDLDEAAFDFPVTGTVVSPEITVHDGSRAAPELTDGQATSIDFGIARQATPTARPITVFNTGTAPLLISGVTTPAGYTVLQLPPLPATIGVNQSLPLQIQLDATAAGTFAGTISIASDDLDEAAFDFPVTGTVVSPEIAVHDGSRATPELTDGQTAAIDFGTTRQATPTARPITVVNTGTAPLQIAGITPPAGYTVLQLPPLPVTIGVNETLPLQIRLDATALGTFAGTITLASDDVDEAAFDFPVTGTVVSPEIAVHDGSRAAPELTDGQTAAIDFGIARQATPTARPITLVNTGTAPLLISSITTPAGYTVLQLPPLPATIGVNETLPLQFRLDATALGTFAGTITLACDDLDEPIFDFPVTGTVVSPEIAVHGGTPSDPELSDGQSGEVDFGRNIQGTPGTRSFTISNTGTAELLVSNLTVPPGFTLQNVPVLPLTVGLNQSATFQISLTTMSVGTHSGSVSITSDDLDEALFDFPVSGQVFIPDPVSSAVSPTTTLNRQTGLREQTIRVTNDTTATVPAYNLIIRGLPAGVEVNNASETRADGSVVVYIRQGMGPHSTQNIVLEYYSPNRTQAEMNPQLSTEAVLNPPDLTVPAGGTGLAVERVTRLPDGGVILEFTTEPGRRYQVQYSLNGRTWQASLPAIRAVSNRTQWIDRGLPRTDSHPLQSGLRFYRVALTP